MSARAAQIGNQVQHGPEHLSHRRAQDFAQLPSQCRDAKSLGIRNRLRRKEAPKPFAERAFHARLGQRTKRTQQIAVRHAARTSGLTRQTAEAPIHMRLRRFPWQRAFQHLLHQHDAPAWCVHFLAQFPIGRARREAEATVHTGLHRTCHGRAERSKLFSFDGVQHQSSREGKRLSGSSACFTAAKIAGRDFRPSQSGTAPEV